MILQTTMTRTRNKGGQFRFLIRAPLFRAALFLAGSACFCLNASPARACGILWNSPRSHFEGLDAQARVFLVEKIGELDLGGGLKLPIQALFKSGWAGNSPYLGTGWQLPLLESNIVQIDDRTFIMRQPGGWYRTFYRTKGSPEILDGGMWKAEIKGEQITAWADCGDKLVFGKGRLLSFSIKDRTFTLVYSGDKVTEIREGGTTKLAVAWNDAGTEAMALQYNGKRLDLARAERPRVQNVAGKNMVVGIDRSLGRASGANLPTKSYQYGVDDRLQPTLKTSARVFTWDPGVGGRIVSDGRWTYDVKPGAKAGDNAAIGRQDAQGQKEFWHNDKKRGTEITERRNGMRLVTSRFVKGALKGKIRRQDIFEGGKLTSSHSWIYDENAKLIREIINQEVITLVRDEKDRLIRKVNAAGETIWERGYDKEDRIVRELINGSLLEHEFLTDGSRKRYQKDPVTGAVLRQWVFDSAGRNTEFTTPEGGLYRVVYDELGRKEKLLRNGTLLELSVFEGADAFPAKEITFRPNGRAIESVREFAINSDGIRQATIKTARMLGPQDLQTLTALINSSNRP